MGAIGKIDDFPIGIKFNTIIKKTHIVEKFSNCDFPCIEYRPSLPYPFVPMRAEFSIFIQPTYTLIQMICQSPKINGTNKSIVKIGFVS